MKDISKTRRSYKKIIRMCKLSVKNWPGCCGIITSFSTETTVSEWNSVFKSINISASASIFSSSHALAIQIQIHQKTQFPNYQDERKTNWNSENPNSKEKEDERWSNKIHDEDSFNVQNQNEAFPVVANCKYFFLLK